MSKGDTGTIFTNTLTVQVYIWSGSYGVRHVAATVRLHWTEISVLLSGERGSADVAARHMFVTRECILRSSSIRVLHSARSTRRHITDWASNMYLKCILLRE